MELTIFKYQDSDVTFDPAAKMWSLNAMHQASGAPRQNGPSFWLNGEQAKALIVALEAEPNTGISCIWETRRGNAGGTWACPELALAYAHYLKPAFYIACNRWMLGQTTALSPAASLEARMAAIEEKLTAMHREFALVPVRRVPTPKGRASLSRTYLRVLAELERLSADTDMVPVAQLCRAIPEVSPNTLRVALCRLYKRGYVQAPAYGHYSLKMA